MTARKNPQRVLAIHRYYWPDTPPYAALLRAIVGEWTRDGHVVDVLTSQPSYKPEAAIGRRPAIEVLDRVKVRRLRMRPDRSSRLRALFNVIWFPLAVARHILTGRRYDVIMCSTVPPVLLGWMVSTVAKLRGARFIYHCMDLHPEIGRLSGDFSNPLVYRLLIRLELSTCRRASAIVVLSEDMRESVITRSPGLASKVVVLTNFELPDFDHSAPLPSPLPRDPSRMRVVFTGNIGRFQGLETITRAVLDPSVDFERLELVFMGDGAAKSELRSLVAAAPESVHGRVRFLDHGPAAQARALLETSDLGLVSLTPEVIRYAYPSKTATYLGAGLPVLVAVERESSLARLVASYAIGGNLPVCDLEATQQTLLDWVERRAELPSLSKRAGAVWRREFAMEQLLPRWSKLLQDVSSGEREAGTP